MRTLTADEMDVLSGGLWWHVAGAVIEGTMTYAERADDGDMTAADWLAVGCGVLIVGRVLDHGFLYQAGRPWH